MAKARIPIILGTARKGRESEKVAEFVLKEAKKHGLDSEILDVRDYRLNATDNTETTDKAKKLSDEVKKADALIIVSPEYNHGYPGELKMMLDMIYDEYEGKPVGVCGVSKGSFGGARMIANLIPVLVAFKMIPVGSPLYFPGVEELFDSKGKITDERYERRVKNFLDSILTYL